MNILYLLPNQGPENITHLIRPRRTMYHTPAILLIDRPVYQYVNSPYIIHTK